MHESGIATRCAGNKKQEKENVPIPFGTGLAASCRVGPSESKMWRIAENKPSVGPPECGDSLAQRASNQSGPEADVRETVSDSGGPWLGPFGSDPRNALALAHPTTQRGGCVNPDASRWNSHPVRWEQETRKGERPRHCGRPAKIGCLPLMVQARPSGPCRASCRTPLYLTVSFVPPSCLASGEAPVSLGRPRAK